MNSNMGRTGSFYAIWNGNIPEEKWIENLRKLESKEKKRAVLVYKQNCKWISLFEESMCEGYIAEREDAEVLSEIFERPVFAFSVFDSDELIVAYSDKKNKISVQYKKSLFDEDEDHEIDFEKEVEDWLKDSDEILIEELKVMCERADQVEEKLKENFPHILLQYADEEFHDTLKNIWNYKEYIFEEDRMEDILEILDMKIFFDKMIPDGYKKLSL